jgi:hypothetical protein
MARPLRIVIEDGWYHVINRGIERRSIFRSAADSGRFLQLLAQLPTRFGLLVHCYALIRIITICWSKHRKPTSAKPFNGSTFLIACGLIANIGGRL